MDFEPIAIVGRACVFPGALSPRELWELVATGRDATSTCVEGRWRIPQERVLGSPGQPEKAWTARGGYVSGFDRVFDPRGFAMDPARILAFDPMVHWLLHTGREALREAGISAPPSRAGAVFGLLGLPAEAFAQFAEDIWLGKETLSASPSNAFLTGLPAHVLARALGLDLGAFALDAACASSLYALKFACDSLRDGRADLMLAGAVNRADDLFLHIGFSTLQAISPTGQSRPFHNQADGLLPAEGAAFVVLKRLADAERAGDRIFGVIRGIGVSNDGRTAGLLNPSELGQEKAIRNAYRAAGLEPADISLLECHSTGTPVGDKCEMRSTSRVFGRSSGVPIGSIKSNLGHPMTAAGMAGLLKLLGAMEAGVRPTTLHLHSEKEAIGEIRGSGFRPLLRNEAWETAGVRRAALSAFGFGGNNGHLILEQWRGAKPYTPPQRHPRKVAVVALGVVTGGCANAREFREAVLSGQTQPSRIATLSLDADRIGFPPADLQRSLPQQVAALQAATEAVNQVRGLDPDRTAVFVGIPCDTEIARYGLRWRLEDESAKDEVCPELTAAAVIGRLANITANRLSSKLDLRGPSCAIFAEELSGIRALELGARALREGELDAAIVGAVDFCVEPVHEAAAYTELPGDRQRSGDAAVFLVLKRLDEAENVLAVLDESGAPSVAVDTAALTAQFGHAHAASGLLHAAAAMIHSEHSAQPVEATVTSMEGSSGSVVLAPAPDGRPRIRFFGGSTREEVAGALLENRQSLDGLLRLAIVSANEDEFLTKRDRALEGLKTGMAAVNLDGIYFRESPIRGELSFVFPGAASAYRGMGRTLFAAYPRLVEQVREAMPNVTADAEWMFEESGAEPTPIEKLWGSSLLCQAHAKFSMGVLGLRPQAVIGVSSGETNSITAMGAWTSLDQFHDEFMRAGVFSHALGGHFEVVGGKPWQTWRFTVDPQTLDRVLVDEPTLRLTAIHADGDYAISGDPLACQRAAERAGTGRAQRLHYDLVVHCPDMKPYAEVWRRLHHRETKPVPGVRFYTHATGAFYSPTADLIADSLTTQALQTLDFPQLIRKAWDDGVRVFLEHGPQGGCTSWIRRILGDRDYLAVSLDLASVDSLRQAMNAQAQLWAAGIPELPAKSGRTLTFPAHAEPIRLTAYKTSAPYPNDANELFRLHTARLIEAQNEFFGQCGAEVHEQFLEISRRAYLHATGASAVAVLEAPAAVPVPIAAPAARPVALTPPPPPAPAAPPPPAVVVVKAAPPRTTPARPASGLTLSRRDLELISSGPISAIYGEKFKPIDQYERVVRMPMPPLLLADRVTVLEGEPGSMGTGRICTETDVLPDSWYLHQGRMPAGIMIESGQADLLLISWLGIDFLVKSERVYRLLGCDLTYHGALPKPGDTLKYDIEIDGHARQGDIRLFFFHYDCRIDGQMRLSVRNGQAGFFTDEELNNSAGVLWSAETVEPSAEGKVVPPRVAGIAKTYDAAQIATAAKGDAFACFGKGFEKSATHHRPPDFANQDLLLVKSITHLDPAGGPWKRGYLRAELPISPDDWFFEGHFKNDPCLPGTLMFEGCLQTMSFYMMALGLTLDRDGWRFEPVPDVMYPLRCRGQVTPKSKMLVYELFIDEVVDGKEPTLYADLLCTVDGLKAFHCRRMGLRLTPGFPTEDMQPAAPTTTGALATVNGVRLDYPALLACAWGPPTGAFGPPFQRFDVGERLPRLPGPPYHFMSRITRIDGKFGEETVGQVVEAEYDVRPEDWYFDDNASPVMPFSVLAEVALQPCGWLSCFTGIPLRAETDLYFRNLDGNGTIHVDVPRKSAIIQTTVKLTNVARSAGITLTSFEVRCLLDGKPLLDCKTTFGFFRQESLAKQVGLPPSAEELKRFREPSSFALDLTTKPERYFTGPLRMPVGILLMIDRITGLWPSADGLGRIRAEKTVNPADWFFKAHFYQDPVQPGSLGLEALLQVLEFFAIHNGLADGIANPRFELSATGKACVWKYRGQVVPFNGLITTEVEVKEVRREAGAVVVIAEGWLWVDGTRTYQFSNFGFRIVAS